ncbi:ribosome silencing factor [Sandarakinorhabdus sp. DWP1-3-1]|uniref:ribosome silencing factor n=1 Tax=Sandarakinorhabdus sp. DWP1-3-1 TaxID=2804627 RepID=UPI003CF6D8D0
MAPTTPAERATVDAHIEALHAMVMQQLDDDQAVDPVSIPLAGKTSIADYMVIASGRSGRQVASMATKIAERVKTEFGRPARVQGLPTADWVLIDAGDVIIHIFRPEVREFYNLERMWAFDSEPNKGEPRMGELREAHESRSAPLPEARDPSLGDPRKLG